MSLWILTVPWPLAPLYGWKSMGITPMLGLTLWGTVAVTEKFFVSVPADLLEVDPLKALCSISYSTHCHQLNAIITLPSTDCGAFCRRSNVYAA